MGGDWRDKAAGLMCVGLGERSLDDRTRELLDAGVAGVLLHGDVLGNPESVAEISHAIKSYAARPVFVAVDHEAVHRHADGSGFSRPPSAPALGESGDVELARSVGQVLGRELRSVGVDLTLGPVLDVATNPDNEVVRGRSLGSDPSLVGRLGAALIEGQQSEGVAACAKHFPGHGDTILDSNTSLPKRPHNVARLEEVELEPFRAAIEARVAGTMVGHILFPSLDESAPASLSRAIVFGLLRQKMGYRGMVVLDDIDMGALTERFSRVEIASLGVASGADCFLCARLPDSAFELIDAIVEGVGAGTILPERIEAARRRIAPLLHRYVRDPGPAPDLSPIRGLRESDILELRQAGKIASTSGQN